MYTLTGFLSTGFQPQIARWLFLFFSIIFDLFSNLIDALEKLALELIDREKKNAFPGAYMYAHFYFLLH